MKWVPVARFGPILIHLRATTHRKLFRRLLGPSDPSENIKIHKNPEKVVFEIAPHFESNFEPIFIDFSFDFQSPTKVKTRLKPWSVVRFYTFPIFVLSFLLGSILDHLGLHFGVVLDSFLLTFFTSKGDKKINDFSHHFFYEFGSILAAR